MRLLGHCFGAVTASFYRLLAKVYFSHARCAVLGADFSRTRRRGRRLEHLSKRSYEKKEESI